MSIAEEQAKLDAWTRAGCFLDFGKPYGSVATWQIKETRAWAGRLQVLAPFSKCGGNVARWMFVGQVKRAWFFEAV